jgi:hypothetical protein
MLAVDFDVRRAAVAFVRELCGLTLGHRSGACWYCFQDLRGANGLAGGRAEGHGCAVALTHAHVGAGGYG